MSSRLDLSAADREFFQLAAQAAFANPFGSERAEIDFKIAGISRPVPRHERLRLALPRVADRLTRLEEKGGADVRHYVGEDQEIITTVFLFEAYYRHAEDFDALIERQLQAGTDSCSVPFAAAALSHLRKRGFKSDDALRFFAMLYQLRRAYYFIGRQLIGESPSVRELRRRLWNSIATHDIRWYVRFLMDRMEDFSTLLLGETGTGKGAAALAIGRSGLIPFDERKGCFVQSFLGAFTAINLSQFPEALIESELFGHRKGAFTGAVGDHEGVLARSSPHGAVFLDEIGEVSIPVQVKLLQVLQERTFQPIGSHDRKRFAGRVVAATNRSLDELRRSGRFRDDFFYRLCSDTITVPPLRQRLAEAPGELDLLLVHTLRRMTGVDAADVASRVREAMDRSLPKLYPWPGNVRELEQCVRSILLTGQYAGDTIGVAADPRTRIVKGLDSGAFDSRGLLAAYAALVYEQLGSFVQVASQLKLDRRTVKKLVADGQRMHTGCANGVEDRRPSRRLSSD